MNKIHLSPITIYMREKLHQLTALPDETMTTIYEHVVCGGSVIDLCEMWGIRYSALMYWIRDDIERDKLYTKALHDRSEWIKETLLRELKRIAASDIRQIYDENGNIKPVHEWPPEIASVVSSIECVEEFEGSGRDKIQTGWNKKIKMWNKEKAIELFGKHLSLFIDRHEVKVTRLEDLVGASMKDPDNEQ